MVIWEKRWVARTDVAGGRRSMRTYNALKLGEATARRWREVGVSGRLYSRRPVPGLPKYRYWVMGIQMDFSARRATTNRRRGPNTGGESMRYLVSQPMQQQKNGKLPQSIQTTLCLCSRGEGARVQLYGEGKHETNNAQSNTHEEAASGDGDGGGDWHLPWI